MRKSRRDQARETSGNVEEEDEADPAEMLKLGTLSPRKNVVLDSRKLVPAHYFDEHFDLSVPALFYKTFYDGTPHKELAIKIDGYLEFVERDLTDKLNKRSDAFFKALRDMQSLQLTVAGSNQRITDIQDYLRAADDELVVNSLEIVNKKTKKHNFVKVQKMMRMMQAVHRSIPNIEKMIAEEDFFGALETIRSAEHAIKHDLKGATALGGFQAKLDRLNKVIKGNLSAQFVDIACGSDVLLSDAVQKLRPLVVEMQTIGQLISTLETYSEIQHQNIKRLVLECFTPLDNTGVPLQTSNGNLGRADIHEPNILSSSSSSIHHDHDSHLSGLASHEPMFNESEEKAMHIYEAAVERVEMEEFFPKLQTILTELLNYIVRFKEVHHLIDQVFKDLDEKERKNINMLKQEFEEHALSSSTEPTSSTANGTSEVISSSSSTAPVASATAPTTTSPQDDTSPITREEISKLEVENQLQKRLRTQISLDSADMVFVSAELINTLIARLLRARAEQHTRMSVQGFASFYNVVSNFVRTVDKQVGRPCPSLRVVINAQAKAMIIDWDRRMCEKMSHTLHAEEWTRAEVAPDFAAILHCLYTPKQNIHTLEPSKEAENAKSLTLGTERYTFVLSELIFVKLLYDYLVFLDTLPSLYTEVITKIGEAINLWSKLTYGLILKGGALENGVVTGSINVAHLSLAANCLGVQLVLIPRIKERVLAYIHDPNEISVLSCLDKSTEECTTHQQAIYSKMITTMRNRLETCFKMYKIDEATDKINPAIAKLMEATQKMHKILKSYLGTTPFKAVFKQIISMYNNQIKQHISQLTIKTPKEKAKLLNDIHHILTELRSLDNVEDPTDELVEYVHERFKA